MKTTFQPLYRIDFWKKAPKRNEVLKLAKNSKPGASMYLIFAGDKIAYSAFPFFIQ